MLEAGPVAITSGRSPTYFSTGGCLAQNMNEWPKVGRGDHVSKVRFWVN